MTRHAPRDPRAVAADYDAGADDYDARHAVDPRTVRRHARIDGIQRAAIGGALDVLEIGCGTGRLLAQVEAPRRTGIDIAAQMLRHAAARGLAVARADAHLLPFRDAAFDAILAGNAVFRYLALPRALAECARVLRPRGRLVVHLHGGRTLSLARLRGLAPQRPGVFEPAVVAEVLEPAAHAGFAAVAVHRLRSVRMRPYLLEIPAWIDRHVPAQLWSHVVFVLERSGPR